MSAQGGGRRNTGRGGRRTIRKIVGRARHSRRAPERSNRPRKIIQIARKNRGGIERARRKGGNIYRRKREREVGGSVQRAGVEGTRVGAAAAQARKV